MPAMLTEPNGVRLREPPSQPATVDLPCDKLGTIAEVVAKIFSVHCDDRAVCSQNGNRRGWNSANQSPRVTAFLPFLTQDVHGIPEEHMPIVEGYPVAVALDFALGPTCRTVVTYR